MSVRQPRRAWGSLESDTMAVLWAATDPLTPAQVQAALADAHGNSTGTQTETAHGNATGTQTQVALADTHGNATGTQTEAAGVEGPTGDTAAPPRTGSGTGAGPGGGTLAYNTVQTILIRLLDKGLVSRRAAGRGHVYWPTDDAATAAAARMRAVLDGPGDRHAVLQHFADGLDPGDVDVLRALLDRDDGGSPG